MIDALCFNTPVEIVRHLDSFWIVVKFLEKCSRFRRGETVCISKCNIVMRTPIQIKRRYK